MRQIGSPHGKMKKSKTLECYGMIDVENIHKHITQIHLHTDEYIDHVFFKNHLQ